MNSHVMNKLELLTKCQYKPTALISTLLSLLQNYSIRVNLKIIGLFLLFCNLGIYPMNFICLYVHLLF